MHIPSRSSSSYRRQAIAAKMPGAAGSILRSSRLRTSPNGKHRRPSRELFTRWRQGLWLFSSARWKSHDSELPMKEERINSAAFQKAELQSERLRIFGVLGFFFVFTVVTAIRVFLIQTASGTAPRMWQGLFLVAIVM